MLFLQTLSAMDSPPPGTTVELPKDIFSTPEASLSDPLSKPNIAAEKAVSGDLNAAKSTLSQEKKASKESEDLFHDPLVELEAKSVPDVITVPLPEPAKSDITKKTTASSNVNTGVVDVPQNDIKKSQDILDKPLKVAAPELPTDLSSRPLTAELFDDGDEDDLFEEPLRAAAKKPQAPLFEEQSEDLFVGAKTEGKAASKNKAFTQQTNITAPPAATRPNSKANGLPADDDDLFAGRLFDDYFM